MTSPGVDVDVPGIREEDVADSAPMVRALVVQRLEMIWRSCEPHIDGLLGKPDPRFIEAGIRVVDRLTALYGLTRPQQVMSEPETASREEYRAVITAKLDALEAKLKVDTP